MAEDKKTDNSVKTPVAPVTATAPVAPVPTQPIISELSILQNKAGVLGVAYSSEDSVESLKEKIDAKLNPKDSDGLSIKNEESKTKAQSEIEFRQQHYEENMRLIRCRITCMNPSKADLNSEFHTVSNKYLGAVTRAIPYGNQDDGWHVEKVLLDHLMDKQFQQIRTVKNSNGSMLPSTKWVKEFAIEILPDLTLEELRVLANQQAAAAGRAV